MVLLACFYSFPHCFDHEIHPENAAYYSMNHIKNWQIPEVKAVISKNSCPCKQGKRIF